MRVIPPSHFRVPNFASLELRALALGRIYPAPPQGHHAANRRMERSMREAAGAVRFAVPRRGAEP
ncbi:MAG: hypothetical protein ACJA2W_003373, partial [Planctomycetota bacterium]